MKSLSLQSYMFYFCLVELLFPSVSPHESNFGFDFLCMIVCPVHFPLHESFFLVNMHAC